MKITLEDLLKIIAKSLNIKASKINLKTKDTDLEEWDSLGQLAILTTIDKKLKNKTSKLTKLATAESVKDIYAILKKAKLIN